MCAYLHTKQGRGDFGVILKRERDRKRLIESPLSVTSGTNEVTEQPEVVTYPDAVTVNEVTIDETEVTSSNFHPGAVTETKQQRYRRLNKERVNQRERDRRNGVE